MTETGQELALRLEHRFAAPREQVFHEDGDGTLVKLTHSGFGSEEERGKHTHGWQAVLANLEANVFS
jgi:uncharacterized protein YndB with AHSA1/START domain